MLDDGLDPPIWTQGRYHQPNWVPCEQSRNKAHHCSLGKHTEFSFCCFIMGSHRRSSQRVKNLCETDEDGVFFSFHTNCAASNLTHGYIGLKMQFIQQNTIFVSRLAPSIE